MLIALIAGLVGILRTKIWGKYIYLGSAAFGYLLAPTLGPTVEHAYSAAIYDLSSLAAGGAITLLLFTQSSFNKWCWIGPKFAAGAAGIGFKYAALHCASV